MSKMNEKQVSKSFVENTSQVAETIGHFDSAVETKLFFGNKENPQDVTNFKGIYNMGTGLLTTVATKQYQIIQHNDVAQALVEALAGLNLQVKGLVKNYRDKICFDLYFDDSKYDLEDGEKGIKLGIRVVNSYDKSNSFRLEMFAYRLICKNGMAIGSAVNSVKQVVVHTGEKKPLSMIKSTTEIFIKNVINSSEKLQRLVNLSMEDSIEWNLAERIIEKLMPIQKHREEILARIEVGQQLTRWDLYNAITNYTTHDEALKPSVVSAMEVKSRKVLVDDFAKMEEELLVEVNQ
ncbi:DUF932 domain-containing protein [Candidatus Bathyarchaeota archaeon]|nr:DUF932 domain-containing protein [Candidatus Bathyarchaeota archaeon]